MQLKKIAKALFSMRTALILLGLLVLACVAGSVIPQQEIDAYYTGYYPERMGMLILLTGLNDVFHSVWFVVLTLFLCLNLLGCNMIHFPRLMKQMSGSFTPQRYFAAWQGEALVKTEDPEPLFRRLGFHKIQSETIEGQEVRYSVRNKLGLWGAWLTHLGLLVIILGFSLGQMYTVKYTVYGVPGQTKQVADTHYALTIDEFRVDLRADETVEQYTSRLTLTDLETRQAVTGQSSVNHPLKAHGMKLYQNSTGWAATVTVFKGEQLLQQELLCAGEHLTIADLPDLVVAFRSFYPDYIRDASGKPATASSALRNPAYLYALYYQEGVLGMNVLQADERITVEDYSIIFSDPQQYTLIQIKSDPFTWLAGIGGILIILALFLAFYLRTEELLAVRLEDGTWALTGRSKKGGILFQERILEAAQHTLKE